MESGRGVGSATDFHRAIQEKIGEMLSDCYDLSTPLPDRIRILLGQPDEPSAVGAPDGGNRSLSSR
jgi:hypothetical protein